MNEKIKKEEVNSEVGVEVVIRRVNKRKLVSIRRNSIPFCPKCGCPTNSKTGVMMCDCFI